nr:amidohydrolase family protein [Rhodococcus sp. BS-15]
MLAGRAPGQVLPVQHRRTAGGERGRPVPSDLLRCARPPPGPESRCRARRRVSPHVPGRSDHAWRVRPEARRCALPPSDYLGRITFDSIVHGPGALRALIDAVGPQSVVLGSDYPFDMGNENPVAELRAAELSADVTRSILSGNAERLGLSPAPTGVNS